MQIKMTFALCSLFVLQACAFALKPVAYSAVFTLKVPIETVDASVNLAYAATDEVTNVSTTAIDVSQQTVQTIMKDTMELTGHFIDPDAVEIEGESVASDDVD